MNNEQHRDGGKKLIAQAFAGSAESAMEHLSRLADHTLNVTPEILRPIISIGFDGWKLRKRGGHCAEIVKADIVCRVKYSVFSGLEEKGANRSTGK